MEPYLEIFTTLRSKTSFGYETIHIFKLAELKSAQVGYSVSSQGKSLIGDQDGDWRKSWLVIGYEECCGDPVFIDTAMKGVPVYTAIHGEGRWDSQQIADSLAGFGNALTIVARVGEKRDNPQALEDNPLPDEEKRRALLEIRLSNPQINLEFWEILLDTSD